MPNSATANSNMVSAKLEPDLYDFIENYRWDHRLTKSVIIIEALTTWATEKGFILTVKDDPPNTGDAR